MVEGWNAWRQTLTREDVEGNPGELVYAAYQRAFEAALAASQARVQALEGALHQIANYHRMTINEYAETYREPADDEVEQIVDAILAAGPGRPAGSEQCGVWYRAGACILAKRHDGLHLTQEQQECATVREQLATEREARRLAEQQRDAAVAALREIERVPSTAMMARVYEIARAALAGEGPSTEATEGPGVLAAARTKPCIDCASPLPIERAAIRCDGCVERNMEEYHRKARGGEGE